MNALSRKAIAAGFIAEMRSVDREDHEIEALASDRALCDFARATLTPAECQAIRDTIAARLS